MNRKLFRILTVTLLFLTSCSSESPSHGEKKGVHEEEVVENKSAEVVFLNVSDPSQFIMELANTCDQIRSYVSDDNPNAVLLTHIIHKSQDHKIFDQLKEVVQLDLTFVETMAIEPIFRVSIRHKVKDYETWKWLYDGNQKNRDREGLILVQMGTVKGNPNEVFMIFAIPDIAKAREMMNNPELLNKMKQGGVLGDPQIKFWRLASEV
jgi:hypothetical protein